MTCSTFGAKVLADDNFGNTGFYSLATVYLISAAFSFFVSPILHRVPIKYTMSLAAFTYVFWILCFYLVSIYADYKKDHPQ